MGLERKMFRGMFLPGEVVRLKQPCFTPGRLFEPGKYNADELPDIAFEMGLVDHCRQSKARVQKISMPRTRQLKTLRTKLPFAVRTSVQKIPVCSKNFSPENPLL